MIRTLQSEKEIMNQRLLKANKVMMEQNQDQKNDREECLENRTIHERYVHVKDAGVLWSTAQFNKGLKLKENKDIKAYSTVYVCDFE